MAGVVQWLTFIGGPKDGDIEMVKDGQNRVEVPIRGPLGAPNFLPGGSRAFDVEATMPSATYRRVNTLGGEVMLFEGLGVKEMVVKLLAGYVPGVREEGDIERHGDCIGVKFDRERLQHFAARGGRKATVVLREP